MKRAWKCVTELTVLRFVVGSTFLLVFFVFVFFFEMFTKDLYQQVQRKEEGAGRES